MKKFEHTNKWSYFSLGLILGLIFSAGFYFVFLYASTPSVRLSGLRQSDLGGDGYKFIDPLLAVKGTVSNQPKNYVDLQKSIQSIIDTNTKEGNLVTSSVSFRDINLSASLILNPNEKYSPASLLKVPSMMAYYKASETDPSVLSRRLVYTGANDLNLQENIRSPIQLKKNTSYPVESLIEHMIKYSDNNAATLLADNMNKTDKYDFANNLFNDLGIHQISTTNDFMTIKDYDLFFRVLYNSTYLNRDMSEKSLDILSQSDFSKGLDAGVPNNIIVSHKFGEFSELSTSGQLLRRELHDCGVVYYPAHPYILCVMTKGKDFTQLESVIAQISQTVFHYMENEYPSEAKTN